MLVIQKYGRWRTGDVTATTAPAGPNEATTLRDRKEAMGNLAWIAGAALIYVVFVGVASVFPVEDETQPNIKLWLSLVAAIGAIVQLATISRVYNWSKRIPPGAAATLSAVHRWSGRMTIAVGGGVAYLCMTGPFAGGFTPHRFIGYVLVFIILVKVVILRVAEKLSGLLPLLGLMAVAGWIACFLTKALVIWF